MKPFYEIGDCNKTEIEAARCYSQWREEKLQRVSVRVRTPSNKELKRTMYQRKVDVDMLDAVKSVLATKSSTFSDHLKRSLIALS